MQPDGLRAIEVPRELPKLLSLPPPPQGGLTDWPPAELRECLRWGRRAWLSLLCDEISLPGVRADRGNSSPPGATFSLLARNVGTWFSALNEAHRASDRNKRYSVFFTLADIDRLYEAEHPADDHPYAQELAVSRVTLDAYIKAVLGATLIPSFSGTPIRATEAQALIEVVEHGALARLHDVQVSAADPRLRDLAVGLLNGLLHAVVDGYEAIVADHEGRTWTFGPYSDLQIEELRLLATRHDSVIRRFGAKSVEKRFEQQLSLLFQSLGFIVIQTRSGTRTVDLVCISSDATSPLTFIVEAKTSKAAYALPARDERALRDYVADIDRTLITMPSLRFVLLVADKATRTLAGKLRSFETKSGKSIRFIDADALTKLRVNLPGPAPVAAFAAAVLNSEVILPDTFVSQVVEGYRRQQDAHQHFVEALMNANGSDPGTSDWPSS